MKVHSSWQKFLKEEISKPYYVELTNFLNYENEQGKIIYPEKENIFNFLSVPPEKVKVVILGQDPYHGYNQAHGYSFSVKEGVKIPPSLVNIFKEIENEFNYPMSKTSGDLTPWVQQGVFLLNSVLTVEQGNAASHKGKGWEIFTDHIIKIISEHFDNKVFMLWGKFAQDKEKLINKQKHLILKSPHPSPFSAHTGFLGNNHFKESNNYLETKGIEKIDWKI